MTLSRADYVRYLGDYVKRDFPKQLSYYADNITFHHADGQFDLMTTKESIQDHCNHIDRICHKHVIPMVLMNDGHKILSIIENYFTYREKAEAYGYLVEPGETVKICSWTVYEVEDRKIQRLVTNLFQKWNLGKADIREMIQESVSRAEPDLRDFYPSTQG